MITAVKRTCYLCFTLQILLYLYTCIYLHALTHALAHMHGYAHTHTNGPQLGEIFTIHAAGKRMTFVTNHEDFHHYFTTTHTNFQSAVQPFTMRAGTAVQNPRMCCEYVHLSLQLESPKTPSLPTTLPYTTPSRDDSRLHTLLTFALSYQSNSTTTFFCPTRERQI